MQLQVNSYLLLFQLYVQQIFLSMYFLHEVLDTAAGVWLDKNGIVTTSSRSHKSSPNEHDSSELLRRCRHAAASVGSQIYVYGGLKGGKLNYFLQFILIMVRYFALGVWLTDF